MTRDEFFKEDLDEDFIDAIIDTANLVEEYESEHRLPYDDFDQDFAEPDVAEDELKRFQALNLNADEVFNQDFCATDNPIADESVVDEDTDEFFGLTEADLDECDANCTKPDESTDESDEQASDLQH